MLGYSLALRKNPSVEYTYLNLCLRCFASKKNEKRRTERDSIIYNFATTNTKRAQRIYGFGFTLTGALGLRDFVLPPPSSGIKREIECVRRPVRIPFFSENGLLVNKIACGFGFSLFTCKRPKKGWELYGCGVNTDSQLGKQTGTEHSQVSGTNVELLLSPQVITLPQSSTDHSIAHIGCGRAHSIVACQAGSTGDNGSGGLVNRLYTFGNNAFGQCGRQIVDGEIYADSGLVTEVVLPEGLKDIKQVVCGQDHTLLLTSDGRVYSCGQGTDGQTGLQCYHNISQLSLVEGDIANEKIVHLSSRGDTVLAVSASGQVFGWGNNEYGQLMSAAGSEMQLSVPRNLPLPSTVGQVLQTASAGSVCALLDHRGHVFVWGFGQLGLGPSKHSAPQPTQLPPPLFGHTEFSREPIHVEQISCGLHHLAAVNSVGQLFTWGAHRSGCLGLSTQKDQSYPLRVCVPSFCEQAICGVDHTLLLARAFA